MVVGKTNNTVKLSENIFEDNFLNNTLIFGDKQSNINNFIMQNTLQSNQQFILLDTGKKFRKCKDLPSNIVKIDFKDNIYFDPFKFAINEYEVKLLSGMILSSYRFVTKQKDTKNLGDALVYFMNAVIGFVSVYFHHELGIESVYKLAKTWKETQNDSNNTVLDVIFSEKLKMTVSFLPYPLRNYFEFKLLPISVQKEAANECISILKELNNRKYFKNTEIKEINLDEIINNNKSLILIPSDESYEIRFKVEEYIITKILNSRKTLEISKTKFTPMFALDKNEEPQYNLDIEDINKIHLIIDGFDKMYHSQIFKKSLSLVFNTISITIINESGTALNTKEIYNFLTSEFTYRNMILFSSKDNMINKFVMNKINRLVTNLPDIDDGQVIIVKYSDIDQPPNIDILIDNISISQDINLDYTISLYHTAKNSKVRRNSDPSTWKF